MKSPKLNDKQESELRNVVYLNEHSSREVKRAQAIMLVDKGIDTPTITNLTGLGRSQIFNLRSNYLNIGLGAIEDKKEKNPNRLLTKKQRAAIIEAVCRQRQVARSTILLALNNHTGIERINRDQYRLIIK